MNRASLERSIDRPTSWWLAALRRRRAHLSETLDLSRAVVFEDEAERDAAVRFFNAAFRAEESGLRQAHDLAHDFEHDDPELAECLRLYGDEEGWHRELLTSFLAHIGGEVRPMGPTTRTFYKLYARAERMETIVLTNLMFETIGATTYRLALRRARPDPTVRQMLTILTRDESFHVPLNAHFLRRVLAREGEAARRRSQRLYRGLTWALVASAAASRRRALRFDRIPFSVLARAYAVELSRLFVRAPDLGLQPSRALVAFLGREARVAPGIDPLGIDAATAAIDRADVTASP